MRPHSAASGAAQDFCPRAYELIKLAGDLHLAKGRVHELQGDGAESFALVAASRVQGPLIWCGRNGDVGSLAPTAVQRFIDPARLLMVEGVSRAEVMWAGEQALRSSGISCVVIELGAGPSLRDSRRLQIACEESGAIGFVLVRGRAQTSAAETRWHCKSLSDQGSVQGQWEWRCTKNRKGELGVWRASWRGDGDGPNTVHLVAATAA